MEPDERFESIDEINEIPESRRIIRRTIIRGDATRISKPVKVALSKKCLERKAADFAQPIIRGSDILGVLHTCACGKTAEIMFDFELGESDPNLDEGSD